MNIERCVIDNSGNLYVAYEKPSVGLIFAKYNSSNSEIKTVTADSNGSSPNLVYDEVGNFLYLVYIKTYTVPLPSGATQEFRLLKIDPDSIIPSVTSLPSIWNVAYDPLDGLSPKISMPFREGSPKDLLVVYGTRVVNTDPYEIVFAKFSVTDGVFERVVNSGFTTSSVESLSVTTNFTNVYMGFLSNGDSDIRVIKYDGLTYARFWTTDAVAGDVNVKSNIRILEYDDSCFVLYNSGSDFRVAKLNSEGQIPNYWVRRTAPANNNWNSVAWSPTNGFVAVSSSGLGVRVMVSTDGESWTTTGISIPSPAKNWASVTRSSTLFVVVGESGAVMTSPDGLMWTYRTAPIRNWTSVTWSSTLNLYLAVGDAGSVMSSSDGITWTVQTQSSNDWNSVLWVSTLNLFVAVGESGAIMTSSNGFTWTQITLDDTFDRSWTSVTWSPTLSRLVAVGSLGSIMTSSNGSSWVLQNGPFGNWTSVTWATNLGFVAVGGSGSMMRSLDGISWTAQSVIGSWRSITFAPGILVAVGSTGALATTIDDAPWVNTPVSNTVAHSAYLFQDTILVSYINPTNQIVFTKISTENGAVLTPSRTTSLSGYNSSQVSGTPYIFTSFPWSTLRILNINSSTNNIQRYLYTVPVTNQVAPPRSDLTQNQFVADDLFARSFMVYRDSIEGIKLTSVTDGNDTSFDIVVDSDLSSQAPVIALRDNFVYVLFIRISTSYSEFTTLVLKRVSWRASPSPTIDWTLERIIPDTINPDFRPRLETLSNRIMIFYARASLNVNIDNVNVKGGLVRTSTLLIPGTIFPVKTGDVGSLVTYLANGSSNLFIGFTSSTDPTKFTLTRNFTQDLRPLSITETSFGVSETKSEYFIRENSDFDGSVYLVSKSSSGNFLASYLSLITAQDYVENWSIDLGLTAVKDERLISVLMYEDNLVSFYIEDITYNLCSVKLFVNGFAGPVRKRDSVAGVLNPLIGHACILSHDNFSKYFLVGYTSSTGGVYYPVPQIKVVSSIVSSLGIVPSAPAELSEYQHFFNFADNSQYVIFRGTPSESIIIEPTFAEKVKNFTSELNILDVSNTNLLSRSVIKNQMIASKVDLPEPLASIDTVGTQLSSTQISMSAFNIGDNLSIVTRIGLDSSAGQAFAVGQGLKIEASDFPGDFFEVEVVSYNPATGELVAEVTNKVVISSPPGVYTGWNIIPTLVNYIKFIVGNYVVNHFNMSFTENTIVTHTIQLPIGFYNNSITLFLDTVRNEINSVSERVYSYVYSGGKATWTFTIPTSLPVGPSFTDDVVLGVPIGSRVNFLEDVKTHLNDVLLPAKVFDYTINSELVSGETITSIDWNYYTKQTPNTPYVGIDETVLAVDNQGARIKEFRLEFILDLIRDRVNKMSPIRLYSFFYNVLTENIEWFYQDAAGPPSPALDTATTILELPYLQEIISDVFERMAIKFNQDSNAKFSYEYDASIPSVSWRLRGVTGGADTIIFQIPYVTRSIIDLLNLIQTRFNAEATSPKRTYSYVYNQINKTITWSYSYVLDPGPPEELEIVSVGSTFSAITTLYSTIPGEFSSFVNYITDLFVTTTDGLASFIAYSSTETYGVSWDYFLDPLTTDDVIFKYLTYANYSITDVLDFIQSSINVLDLAKFYNYNLNRIANTVSWQFVEFDLTKIPVGLPTDTDQTQKMISSLTFTGEFTNTWLFTYIKERLDAITLNVYDYSIGVDPSVATWSYYVPEGPVIDAGTLEAVIKEQFETSSPFTIRDSFLTFLINRFENYYSERLYAYELTSDQEEARNEVVWYYTPNPPARPESTFFVFSDADPNTMDTLLGFSTSQNSQGTFRTLTSNQAVDVSGLVAPFTGNPLRLTLIENNVDRYVVEIAYQDYTETQLFDALKTQLNSISRPVGRPVKTYNYSYDSTTRLVTWSYTETSEEESIVTFFFDRTYQRNLAPMLGFLPTFGDSAFNFYSVIKTVTFSFNLLNPPLTATIPGIAFGGSFTLIENSTDQYTISIPSQVYTIQTFAVAVKTELNSIVRPIGQRVLMYDFIVDGGKINWVFEGYGSAAFSFIGSYALAPRLGFNPDPLNEVFSFNIITSKQPVDESRLFEEIVADPPVGLYIKKLDEDGNQVTVNNINVLDPIQSLLSLDGYGGSLCVKDGSLYVGYVIGNRTLTDYQTFVVQRYNKDTFANIWTREFIVPDSSLDTVFTRLFEVQGEIHLLFVRNNDKVYSQVFEIELANPRRAKPYDLNTTMTNPDKRELKVFATEKSVTDTFYMYLAYPEGNNINVRRFLSDTYSLSTGYWEASFTGGSSTPKESILLRESPGNNTVLISYTRGVTPTKASYYAYLSNAGAVIYDNKPTNLTNLVNDRLIGTYVFDDYGLFFGLKTDGNITAFKAALDTGVVIGGNTDNAVGYVTGPILNQPNKISINMLSPWNRIFIGRVEALASTTSSTTIDMSTLVVGGPLTLTVGTGLSYIAGNNLSIISTEAPRNFMEIVVTGYNSSTGVLTGTIEFVVGIATYSSWKIRFNNIVVDKLTSLNPQPTIPANEASQYQSHVDQDDNIYPIYYAGNSDGVAMTKFTEDGNPILQRSFTLYGQTPAISGDNSGSLVVSYVTFIDTFINYLAVSLRGIDREDLSDIWTYSVIFDESSGDVFRPRVRIYGDRVFTAYKNNSDRVYIQVNSLSTGQLVKHINTGLVMTAEPTELSIEVQSEKIVYIAFPNGGNNIRLVKYNIESGSAVWDVPTLENGIVGAKSSIILRYNQNLQNEFISFDTDLNSGLSKTEMAAVFASLGVDDRSDFVWNLFGLGLTETLSYDQFVQYMYPNNPIPGLPLPDPDFFGYRDKNGLYVSYTNNGSELRLAKVDQLDGTLIEWSVDTGITDVYGGKAHAFYISNNVPLVFAIEDKNWGITWASGLSLFVAVGSESSVMTSPDGVSWTGQTASAGNWNSVVWSPTLNLLAAVGSNGSLMTSSDGSSWTLRSGPIRNWNSITWSVTTGFVAVGSLGAVMTSLDGIIWTLQSAQVANWNSVTWASGLNLLIAVGSSGAVMTSPNGITWSSVTLPSPLNTRDWNSVTWAQSLGLVVVVGDSGAVMTSPNGSTTWVSQTAPGNKWNSITFDSGLLVAVGARGAIMTSNNATSWTLQTSPDKIWNSVVGNGLSFVAVSSSGAVIRTIDGTVWTTQSSTYVTTPNITVRKFYADTGLEISSRKKDLDTFDIDLFVGSPAVISREFWDAIWLVFPDPTGGVYPNWAILVNKLVAPAVPDPSETYVRLSDKQFLSDCDNCVYTAYVTEEGPNTVSISKTNANGVVEHVKDLEIGGQSPSFIVYNDEVIFVSFSKRLVTFSDFVGLYTMSINSDTFETNWRTERLLNDTFVEYFKPLVEKTDSGVHVTYFRQDRRMYIDTYVPENGIIVGSPYASPFLAPATTDLEVIKSYVNEVYSYSTDGYLYVARQDPNDYSNIQVTKYDPSGITPVWTTTYNAGTLTPKTAMNMKTSRNDLYTSTEKLLLGFTDNATAVKLSSIDTDGTVSWTSSTGLDLTNVYGKQLHNMQVTGGFTLMFFVRKQASNIAITTVKFDDDGAVIETRDTEGPTYQQLLGSYIGQYTTTQTFPAPVPPFIIEYELNPDIIIGYPYIVSRQPWDDVYLEFYHQEILQGLETTTPRRLGVVGLNVDFSYGITNVKSELSDYQLDSDPTKITYVIYNDTDIGGIKLSKMDTNNVELLVVVVDTYGENPSIVLDGDLVYVTYVRKQFGFTGASVRVVKKYDKITLVQEGDTIEYYYIDSDAGVIQPRLTKTAEKLFMGYKRQDDRIYIDKVDKGAFSFELIKQLDEDFSTILPGDLRLRGLEDNISLLYTGASNSVLRRFSPEFVELWSTTIERALAAKTKEDESIIIAYRDSANVLKVKSLDKTTGVEEWTSNLGLTNIVGNQVSNIYLIFGYTLTFCVNTLGKMVVSKFMRDGTFVSQITSDLPGLIVGNIQDFPVTISRSSWNTLTLGYYTGVASELEISPSLWIAIKNFAAVATIPSIPAAELSDNQVDKDGVHVYVVHTDDVNRLLVTKHLLTTGAIVASYLLNTDNKPFSPSLRYKDGLVYVSYVKYEIGYTEIVEMIILTLRASDLGLVSRVSRALADPSQATFRPRIAIVDTPTPFSTSATSGTGSLATITTTTAHGLSIGDKVTVSGVSPDGYNGSYTVVSVPSSTQFTYFSSATGSQTTPGNVVVGPYLIREYVRYDNTINFEKFDLKNDNLSKPLSTGIDYTGLDPQKIHIRGSNPELQISTAADADVTNISGNGTTVTITTSVAHGFKPEDRIDIVDASPSEYNGTFTVTETPSTTQFRYSKVGRITALTTSINITTMSGDGSTVTVNTSSAHGLQPGFRVVVVGAVPAGFNGIYEVEDTPSSTEFTFLSTITGSATTPGKISITSTAYNIVSIVGSGSIATITTSIPHGLIPGDNVSLTGAVPAGFNGIYEVEDTPSSTEFTILNSTLGLATTPGIVTPLTNSLMMSNITGSGTTVTVTTSTNHNLIIGDQVAVFDAIPIGFNGVYTVTATPSSTQFRYANTTTNSQAITGKTRLYLTGVEAQVQLVEGAKDGLLFMFPTTAGETVYRASKLDARNLATLWTNNTIDGGLPVETKNNPMARMTQEGDYYYLTLSTSGPKGLLVKLDAETGSQEWVQTINIPGVTTHNQGMDIFGDYPMIYTVNGADNSMVVNKFNNLGDLISSKVTALTGMNYATQVTSSPHVVSLLPWQQMLVLHGTTTPALYYNATRQVSIRKFDSGFTYILPLDSTDIRTSQGKVDDVIAAHVAHSTQAGGNKVYRYRNAIISANRLIEDSPGTSVGFLPALSKWRDQDNFQIVYGKSLETFTEVQYISHRNMTANNALAVNWVRSDVVLPEANFNKIRPLIKTYENRSYVVYVRQTGNVVVEARNNSDGTLVQRMVTNHIVTDVKELVIGGDFDLFVGYVESGNVKLIKFSVRDEENPFVEEWAVTTDLGTSLEKRSFELSQNVPENLIVSSLAYDPAQNELLAFTSNINQETGELEWTQRIFEEVLIEPTERLNGFSYEGSYSNTTKVGYQVLDNDTFTIDVLTYNIDSFGSRIRLIKDILSEETVQYQGNPLVMFNQGDGFGILAYISKAGEFTMERYLTTGGAVRAIFDNDGRATHPAYPGEFWWRPFITMNPTLQGKSLQERVVNNIVDADWASVVWSGNNLLAVGPSTNPERVMVSNLGITWGAISLDGAEFNKQWSQVIWAEGLGFSLGYLGSFVAVSRSGTVMTSFDGINWVSRLPPVANKWSSVAWSPELGGETSEGRLVAVASGGTNNRVMISDDGGITWYNTGITGASSLVWNSITWSKKHLRFVVVGSSGIGQRAMWSSDGLLWNMVNTPADNSWVSVRWSVTDPASGDGIFIAVASSGSNGNIMTSVTGVTWVLQGNSVIPDSNIVYTSITWSIQLSKFVAVAKSGTVSRILVGDYDPFSGVITWSLKPTPALNNWNSVIWVRGIGGPSTYGAFIAVSSSGVGNRAMRSSDGNNWSLGKTIRDVGSGSFKGWFTNGHLKFEKRYDEDGNITDIERTYYNNGQWAKEIDYGSTALVREFALPTKMNMPELFRRFDTDSDEFISREELICGIRSYALNVPDLPLGSSPIDKLVARMDDDLDGKISYEEFARVMPLDFYTRDIVNKIGFNRAVLTAYYSVENGKRSGVASEYETSLPSGTLGIQSAVTFSSDGVSWMSKIETPPRNWTSMIWSTGLRMFAAVGDSGAIMTSPDGIEWYNRLSITKDWTSVTWATTLNSFVAVGKAGGAISSQDGVSWTFRSVSIKDWNSVTWATSLGLLVAVGDNGALMTSSNTILWNDISLPVPLNTKDWKSVDWGVDRFVAVGSSGAVMTSTNGTTWSNVTLPSPLNTRDWKSVTWSTTLSRFIAVGSAGAIMSSTNGSTWSVVTLPSPLNSKNWVTISWSQNLSLLVVVGEGGSMMVSSNGTSWTEITVPNVNWAALAWSSNLSLFSLLGEDNNLLTSADGLVWEERPAPENNSLVNAEIKDWKQVIWSPERELLVAVGTYGSAMYSSNGTLWNTSNVPYPYSDWTGVTWSPTVNSGNGLFVAIGTSGAAMTSPDAATWTAREAPMKNFRAVTWVAGTINRFVAVGDNGAVITSSDGIEWAERTAPNRNWLSVTQSTSLLVAVGTSGAVMTSTDSVSWVIRSAPIHDWNSVTWSPSLGFVAVSISGAVMRSTNGTTWTAVSAPAGIWTSVTWSSGLNMFAAIGFSGSVITSTNGTTWVERAAPASNWTSLVWADGTVDKFIAVVSIVGRLLKTSNYSDGMLNGLETVFNSDGSIKSSTNYIDNRKTGTYTEFFSELDGSGVKTSVEFDTKGYETPVKTVYSKDGYPEYVSELFAIRTKPVIKTRVTTYWSATQIKSQYYLDVKKLRTDDYVEYTPSGAVYQTGKYLAGQKIGLWITTFETPRFYEVRNAKRVEEIYVKGRLSGVKAVKIFDESNVLIYFRDYPVVS